MFDVYIRHQSEVCQHSATELYIFKILQGSNARFEAAYSLFLLLMLISVKNSSSQTIIPTTSMLRSFRPYRFDYLNFP